MIFNPIKNLFTFLDCWLVSKPKLFDFVFYFFDKSTLLSGYIFRDIRGRFIHFLSYFFLFYYFGPELSCFYSLIESNGLSYETVILGWKNCFSIGFKSVFFVYFFTFEWLFLNIFLTYFESLTAKLKEIYGESVLKNRGYD